MAASNMAIEGHHQILRIHHHNQPQRHNNRLDSTSFNSSNCTQTETNNNNNNNTNQIHTNSNNNNNSKLGNLIGPCHAVSRKHVELCLELKRKLIQEHEHGVPFTLLGKKYHIATSTAANIWRKKEFFLKSQMSGSRKRCNDRSKYKIVNQVTGLFVKTMLEQNKKIDGEVIKKFARRVAAYRNFKDFHGSNGWLDSFKKRENVCWVRRRNERVAAAAYGSLRVGPSTSNQHQDDQGSSLMMVDEQHQMDDHQSPAASQSFNTRSDSPNLFAAATAAAVAATNNYHHQAHNHQLIHSSSAAEGSSSTSLGDLEPNMEHGDGMTCPGCYVRAAEAALAALSSNGTAHGAATTSNHESDHEIEDWFLGIPFLCHFFEEYQPIHRSPSNASQNELIDHSSNNNNNMTHQCLLSTPMASINCIGQDQNPMEHSHQDQTMCLPMENINAPDQREQHQYMNHTSCSSSISTSSSSSSIASHECGPGITNVMMIQQQATNQPESAENNNDIKLLLDHQHHHDESITPMCVNQTTASCIQSFKISNGNCEEQQPSRVLPSSDCSLLLNNINTNQQQIAPSSALYHTTNNPLSNSQNCQGDHQTNDTYETNQDQLNGQQQEEQYHSDGDQESTGTSYCCWVAAQETNCFISNDVIQCQSKSQDDLLAYSEEAHHQECCSEHHHYESAIQMHDYHQETSPSNVAACHGDYSEDYEQVTLHYNNNNLDNSNNNIITNQQEHNNRLLQDHAQAQHQPTLNHQESDRVDMDMQTSSNQQHQFSQDNDQQSASNHVFSDQPMVPIESSTSITITKTNENSNSTQISIPPCHAVSRKHVELCLELKRKLIQEHEHGVPFILLGKKYHIATSTAANIWRKKEFFLRSRMSGSRKRCNDRSKYKIVNQVTGLFVKTMLEQNKKIDGEVIKKFARRVAAYRNFKDFHGSNGWLDSFKKRENVCWVRRRNERVAAAAYGSLRDPPRHNDHGERGDNSQSMMVDDAIQTDQHQQRHHPRSKLQVANSIDRQCVRSDSPNLFAAATAAAVAATNNYHHQAHNHQFVHNSSAAGSSTSLGDLEPNMEHGDGITCPGCYVRAAEAALAALSSSVVSHGDQLRNSQPSSNHHHDRDHEIEDWFLGIPFLCQFFEEYQPALHRSPSNVSNHTNELSSSPLISTSSTNINFITSENNSININVDQCDYQSMMLPREAINSSCSIHLDHELHEQDLDHHDPRIPTLAIVNSNNSDNQLQQHQLQNKTSCNSSISSSSSSSSIASHECVNSNNNNNINLILNNQLERNNHQIVDDCRTPNCIQSLISNANSEEQLSRPLSASDCSLLNGVISQNPHGLYQTTTNNPPNSSQNSLNNSYNTQHQDEQYHSDGDQESTGTSYCCWGAAQESSCFINNHSIVECQSQSQEDLLAYSEELSHQAHHYEPLIGNAASTDEGNQQIQEYR